MIIYAVVRVPYFADERPETLAYFNHRDKAVAEVGRLAAWQLREAAEGDLLDIFEVREINVNE